MLTHAGHLLGSRLQTGQNQRSQLTDYVVRSDHGLLYLLRRRMDVGGEGRPGGWENAHPPLGEVCYLVGMSGERRWTLPCVTLVIPREFITR